MQGSRTVAIALLLLVMLLWGSTFVVTKAGLDNWPPVLFAFARLSIASICLLAIAFVTGKLRPPRPVPWGILLAMGLIGIAIYYAEFNLALIYTSAAQAALVQSCIPIVTTTLAVLFLRESFTRFNALGIALAVLGVAAIFVQGTPSPTARAPWLGNLLMLGAVIAWSVYTVLAKRLAGTAALTIATWVTLIGTLFLGAGAWLEGRSAATPHLTPEGWAVIIYLGIFPSALSFVLYSHALRHLRASQVAIFVNLVPVVGVLAGVLAMGDSLSSSALLGGALVLTGAWISTRSPSG